jgi:hypothetical protein
MFRWWHVREIKWCPLCGEREVNGPKANACAHCEASIEELEQMWRS